MNKIFVEFLLGLIGAFLNENLHFEVYLITIVMN